MNFKAFVYLFSFFLSALSSAETHFLLADPGTSERSNYYRYYNAMRRGYEVLSTNGRNVKVFAKDGSWKVSQESSERLSTFKISRNKDAEIDPNKQSTPTYPPISGSLRNSNDFVSGIQSLGIKDGDSVVVYVTAHGGAPVRQSNPQSATLVAWDEEMRIDHLKEALGKLPKGVKIKLVTTTCYGGGIHHLARELPNVCSASTVSHFQISSAGKWDEFLFSRGFWGHFQEKKRIPLLPKQFLQGFQMILQTLIKG